jgi:cytoskeletal protein CcmA (bactofilin family)
MAASTAPPAAPPAAGVPRPPLLRDRGANRHDSVVAARWIVEGTSKVGKDVRVDELRLNGRLSVGGRLSATRVRGRATLEVAGPVEVAESFVLKGSVRTGATVHAGSAEIAGSLRAPGSCTVDTSASIDGLVEVPGLVARSLQVYGGARIPGTVRTDTLFARLREASTFGVVTGRSVQMYGKVPNLVDKVFFHECDVRVDRIEADAVTLEGVDAEFVRSPQITLGRYCHVTRVEGTIVRQHPSSFVGPESRTPPPYGLRR